MILRWLRNPDDYPRHQNAGYTIMWAGYTDALSLYYNLCLQEWARRGGKNIVCQPESLPVQIQMPPWLGDEELHITHRSALLHKLPEHYKKFGWEKDVSDPKVEYLWPRPVEGKCGEYELCPPKYWKQKKSEKSAHPSQKTKRSHKTDSGDSEKRRSSSRRKRTDSMKTSAKKTKSAEVQRHSQASTEKS